MSMVGREGAVSMLGREGDMSMVGGEWATSMVGMEWTNSMFRVGSMFRVSRVPSVNVHYSRFEWQFGSMAKAAAADGSWENARPSAW